MVEPLLVVGVVATALLLMLSAFFSSSETAIFTVPTEWGESRVRAGDERGSALDRLQEDPHRLLVTLLVGNNVVNIAISSIITVLVVQNLPPGPAVVATTLLTSVLILVFGEIVPKSYGLGNAEEWSLTVAPVVALVEKLLSPIISVFDWVTRGIKSASAARSTSSGRTWSRPGRRLVNHDSAPMSTRSTSILTPRYAPTASTT